MKGKKRSIPRERFLGIYFKESDTDLIAWKKAADTDGENMTQFAKEAIREKLQSGGIVRKLEHPSVVLKRVEAQQQQVYAMVRQIVRFVRVDGMPVEEAAETALEEAQLSGDIIDETCVEAGWD